MPTSEMTVAQLRAKGFMVLLLEPDELKNGEKKADPKAVEKALTEHVWDTIKILAE